MADKTKESDDEGCWCGKKDILGGRTGKLWFNVFNDTLGITLTYP